jgi:hypothetical protein
VPLVCPCPSPTRLPKARVVTIVTVKFTKVRTKTQAIHASSRSTSHKRDKAQGDERRQFRYVAVRAADRPTPDRTYPGVEAFEVMTQDDGRTWTVCKGEDEFGQFLDHIRLTRRRYYDLVRRRGREEMMARIDRNPVSIHTISFSPAQCDLIEDLCQRSEGSDLPRKILAQFAKASARLLAGRRVKLGLALHRDTPTLHVDLAVTRHTGKERIGKAGLGLIGPWGCAVDRQVRSGAVVSKEKLAQFERSLANLRQRKDADEVPFDIMLTRTFDEAAAHVLGPRLVPYIERYAQEVPGLEREQLLATKAELETALAKVSAALDETSPELIREHTLPQPAPEYVASTCGSGRSGTGDVVSRPMKEIDYGALYEPVI